MSINFDTLDAPMEETPQEEQLKLEVQEEVQETEVPEPIEPETVEEPQEQVVDEKPDRYRQIEAAMYEERGQRKSLQEENRALQEKLNQALEWQAEFERRQAEANKAPEPDYYEDPEAFTRQAVNKADEALNQVNERLDTFEKQSKEQQELAQLVNQATVMQEQFAKEHTDYRDAVDHLRNVKIQEAKLAGYDDNQANQYLNQFEMSVVQLANQGKNPAEYAYNLAKQYGFQAPAKAEAQIDPEAAAGVEQAKKQQSAKSLGTGGAAKQFDDMDDNEFAGAFAHWKSSLGLD